MNRKEFLTELNLALSSLPEEERRDALLYYNEYLDDAGLENEDEAIRELGSVQEIAARINAESAIREMEEHPVSPKKGFSAVWIVIIAILSAPIALPLAACAVGLIVVVAALALSLVVCIWAGAIGCIVGGGTAIVLTFTEGVSPLSSILLSAGGGLAAVGLGLLVIIFAIWFTKVLGLGIAALCRSLLSKRKKAKVVEKNEEEGVDDGAEADDPDNNEEE